MEISTFREQIEHDVVTCGCAYWKIQGNERVRIEPTNVTYKDGKFYDDVGEINEVLINGHGGIADKYLFPPED